MKYKKHVVLALITVSIGVLCFAVSSTGLRIRVRHGLAPSNVRLNKLIYDQVSASEFRRQCQADSTLINEWDQHAGRPIDLALAVERLDLVEILLELGVSPNDKMKRIDAQGETPLIFAVKLGDVDAVRMLLAHGANPKITDASGKNARDHAMSSQSSDIRDLLKE